jgi:DNA-directed RNA polymerase specialized sigma24 family protein
VDHYRKIVPTEDIDAFWDLKDDISIENNIDTAKKISEVKKLLYNLKEEQKNIVIMRVWDQMTFSEIASVMGKSESSCKMSFYRSIEIIKKQSAIIVLLILIN